MWRQSQFEIEIRTPGRGFTEVTEEVSGCVAASGILTGLCVVFCPHTSCGLLIQENADPAVLRDLAMWLSTLAPDGGSWTHRSEGPDDMAAHLRTALSRTSITIPVRRGALALGRWQGLWLAEHRTTGRPRALLVHVTGADGD